MTVEDYVVVSQSPSTAMDSDASLADRSRSIVERHGWCIIRDLVDRQLFEEARQEFIRLAADIAPSRRARISLGDANRCIVESGFQGGVIRVSKEFQLYYWNGMPAALHRIFRTLTRIRNELMNLPEAFGEGQLLHEGFVDVCRVILFPVGGGGISKHQDALKDDALGRNYTVLSSLSKIEEHFHSGGGWLIDKRGQRVDFDGLLMPNDIYVFGPGTTHGVDPVDPNEQISWNLDQGRITLNPYPLPGGSNSAQA